MQEQNNQNENQSNYQNNNIQQPESNQQSFRAEKKKIPLWEQFLATFQGAKHYLGLLQQDSAVYVKYFCFLLVLVSLLVVIVPMAGYLIGVGGLHNYVQERIPDFQLENGQLQMEETIEYETSTLKLYGDTDVAVYTKENVDKDAYVQILISKTNVLVYSGGYVMDYPFADYKQVNFNKENLLSMVPWFYCLVALSIVISIIAQACSILFTMLLFSAFGMITNQMMPKRLRFGQLFTLAMYAVTITYTLESLNSVMQLLSPTIVSAVGILWASFTFFAAIRMCGQEPKKNVTN